LVVSKLKQWANFKFYQWLGRIPSGISDMQVQVYGYQSLGDSIVFQWHHAFRIGEVLLIGDDQKKYPTTHTEQNNICEGQCIIQSYATYQHFSVSDRQHIQWWSHKIIIFNIVLQLPTVFSIVICCFRFVA